MDTDRKLTKQAWRANQKHFRETLRGLKKKPASWIEAEQKAHSGEVTLIKASGDETVLIKGSGETVRFRGRRSGSPKLPDEERVAALTTAISDREIVKHRSRAGGWTKATLSRWGIAWPPPKGWRQKLAENYRKKHG
jgi:hypothetical protein